MICEKCIHNAVCKYGEARCTGIYCKCKQFHSRDSVKETLKRFVEICKSHAYYPADTYKGRYEQKVVDGEDIDMELKKMLEELK